jgi:hypothetical protein
LIKRHNVKGVDDRKIIGSSFHDSLLDGGKDTGSFHFEKVVFGDRALVFGIIRRRKCGCMRKGKERRRGKLGQSWSAAFWASTGGLIAGSDQPARMLYRGTEYWRQSRFKTRVYF